MSPTSHFLRSAHNAYSVQNIFSVSSDGLSHIITNPPLQQNWVSMYGVLVSLQATSLTSSWAVTEMFYDLLEQCNICKRNQVHLLHDCVGVRQYAYVHTVLQLQSSAISPHWAGRLAGGVISPWPKLTTGQFLQSISAPPAAWHPSSLHCVSFSTEVAVRCLPAGLFSRVFFLCAGHNGP